MLSRENENRRNNIRPQIFSFQFSTKRIMKRTILLVDDNEEMLEFIADDLSEKYQVITALNGQEALNKLQEESIQLIISDVMMPVMDGFEFCKIIKTSFDYSHIPVVLLTA